MCGIVGYIGQNEAYPVLIAGLKKLEYRGYDSAGVALSIERTNSMSIRQRARWQTWKNSQQTKTAEAISV